MPSIVTVSKNEWEAFLADHSKLIQNYELLLTQLRIVRTKIEGIREKTEQQMVKSGETLRQVKRALDRLSEETERELLESE
jgi:hypothetical protein